MLSYLHFWISCFLLQSDSQGHKLKWTINLCSLIAGTIFRKIQDKKYFAILLTYLPLVVISASQVQHFLLSFAGGSLAPFSEKICHYLPLIENLGGNSQHLLCLWLNGHSSVISIIWKTVKCQVNMEWLVWQSQNQALALGSTSMNRNIWQEMLIRVYVDENGQDFHASHQI